MNARQTSIESYHRLENLAEKRRKVYDIIDHMGEACNLDIADNLGWDINRVTPRTNELVKDGMVEESKRDISRTGRKVIYWRVKS